MSIVVFSVCESFWMFLRLRVSKHGLESPHMVCNIYLIHHVVRSELVLFNASVKLSKRMFTRKQGTNLSIFIILLLSFNEADYTKDLLYQSSPKLNIFFLHLMDMHLSKNWFLQPALLLSQPVRDWEICCRQTTALLSNHYFCMCQCFMIPWSFQKFGSSVCVWHLRMPNYVIGFCYECEKFFVKF